MDFNVDMVWNYFISYDFYHPPFDFSPLRGAYILGAEGEQVFQGVDQAQEKIRKTMNLQPRADPFVNNGESDGQRHEGGETESETADVEIQDAEAPQLPLRRIALGACHGAANNPPDDDEGDGHRRADLFGRRNEIEISKKFDSKGQYRC